MNTCDDEKENRCFSILKVGLFDSVYKSPFDKNKHSYSSMASTISFLIIFVLLIHSNPIESIQPYFPPQITFTINDQQSTMAVDEINQRAYLGYVSSSPSSEQYAYVMQKFPYAIPDSPESKHYVQLHLYSAGDTCEYITYWQYGDNRLVSFPDHWYYNSTSFHIGNYIHFNYKMLHSENANSDEDYWYANEQCQVYSGQNYPCEEIFFKKGTDIPLRYTQVIRQGWDLMQVTTTFQILSIGQPDDHLFDRIPKRWAYICTDVMLAVIYNPQMPTLHLDETVIIQVSLRSPPHRINGNDTVSIEWQPADYSICKDCVTWSPKQLRFNAENFQQQQTLTVTRVNDGGQETLIPTFLGGGFEKIVAGNFFIQIF